MKQIIEIATDHPERHTKETQTINLTLSGGSPWYGYLWIDGKLYTVYKTSRSVQIKRTK